MQGIKPDWPAPDNVLAISTTRIGGTSRGAYQGLNLAQHVGDATAAVTDNRNLLQEELAPGTVIQWLSQVHGVHAVAAGMGSECPEADASWTRERGRACAVLTADCLPVLLCDRAGSVVAAAHAGWRGLLGGVLESIVNAMNCQPADILVWLGPAIGVDAFQVGPEVKSAFLNARSATTNSSVLSCFAPDRDAQGRYLADIYGLARTRLNSVGVDQIYGGNYCTYSAPEMFYSYRRDGETGRMGSLIYLKHE